MTASILSVTDASGKLRGGTKGGTSITITGTGFAAENQVTIGGSFCSVTSQSSTEIICSTGEIETTGYFAVVINVVGTGVFTSTDEFR